MVTIRYGQANANQQIAPHDLLGCTRYETINGENYIDIETTRILERGMLVSMTSDIDGKTREYVVSSLEEPHEGDLIVRKYRCVWSVQGILSAVPSDAMPSGTATNALTQLLRNQSTWRVGTVEPTVTASASFWRMSAWQGMGVLLSTWGGELQQRIDDNGNRYLDILDKLGSEDAFSYAYGSASIERITRKEADSPVYCRVIPLGAAAETDSGGYGRKIDITNVNGGVPYLEDAEKAAEYAEMPYPTPTAYVENSNITEPSELKTWAQSVLQSITRPTPDYEVDFVETYAPNSLYTPQLGDTGTIIDKELGAELEARIITVQLDELAKSVKASISTSVKGEGALAKLIGSSSTLGGINTNGFINMNGRAAYPLYVYGSLPANNAVPLLPCFVLDTSDYGLYYFD